MTQHFKYLNVAFAIAIAVFAVVTVSHAHAQEERRPCANQGSPEGCVPVTRGMPERSATSPNVDDPGVVPVSQWPISRAQREKNRSTSNVPAWEPMKNPAEGTVTVTTPDSAATDEKNSTEEIITSPQ
jgi:hypothetical protein